MTDIRIEMNYYRTVKEYAVIVLYTDAEGESASLNWYPNNRREALKQLANVEKQYNVKGTINQ